MATADTLRAVASKQALYTGVGPVTVQALMVAKYPNTSTPVAISIVAHAGAGTVVLRDTSGKLTDELDFDATGAAGRKEMVFAYVAIHAVTGGVELEVYA